MITINTSIGRIDSHPMHGKSPGRFLHDNADFQLLHISLGSAKLFVFVDASFANNKDYSSQIGFVIVLANEDIDEGRGSKETFKFDGNIVHWSSIKFKRVT